MQYCGLSPYPRCVTSSPALLINALTVKYGERMALDSLDLRIDPGAAFGLLGPNGAGKSTLIGAIAGLIQPDAGRVEVFGQAAGLASRRDIGFVFQDSGLDPFMTCTETLRLQAAMFGESGRPAKERAGAALASVGLSDRAGSMVSTLSGGMRRRLALARGILMRPRLLVLDEPTVGLDPESRRQLWTLLHELRGEGVTALVASQDVDEVQDGCDAVAFLREGRVALAGAVAELRKGLKRDAVVVEFEAIPDGLVTALRGWTSIGSVTVEGETIRLTVDDAGAIIPKLFAETPARITGIRVREATLEDAYFASAAGVRP